MPEVFESIEVGDVVYTVRAGRWNPKGDDGPPTLDTREVTRVTPKLAFVGTGYDDRLSRVTVSDAGDGAVLVRGGSYSGARWYRSAVAAAEAYHARMTDREVTAQHREVTAQRELDAATANRRAAAELLADLKEDA